MNKTFTIDTNNANLLKKENSRKDDDEKVDRRISLTVTSEQYEAIKKFQKKSTHTNVNAFIRGLIIEKISECED